MRYALTDRECAFIQPTLPNGLRGVPRVDDRCVLDGNFWVLRSGAPWREAHRPGLIAPAHQRKRRLASSSPPSFALCEGGSEESNLSITYLYLYHAA